MKKMKVLITGSSGFVGKHLVKELSPEYGVVRYDLKNGQDILDEELLLRKLRGVDVVIHLAAFISAQESWEKPKEYLENNTLGTLSVIRACIAAKVKKLIFFSSAAVKARPLTPYAVSKIAAEGIANLYKDKIKTVIVRPENIYGPGQKEAYGYVIHNFIKWIKSGKKITIFGSGKQHRDFIYIDDVVFVVEDLIKNNIQNVVVSLGTGRKTSILELAGIIGKILKTQVYYKFGAKREEPFASVADIRTLEKIGVNPANLLPLEDGIKRLIELEYSK
jgi:UDP-glucose 4-epimerase